MYIYIHIYMYGCIYMTNLQNWLAETNTILYSNYPPILKKSKMKKT